jgi:hypothetical protein
VSRPAIVTQGSACGATLGWRTLPLWGKQQNERLFSVEMVASFERLFLVQNTPLICKNVKGSGEEIRQVFMAESVRDKYKFYYFVNYHIVKFVIVYVVRGAGS